MGDFEVNMKTCTISPSNEKATVFFRVLPIEPQKTPEVLWSPEPEYFSYSRFIFGQDASPEVLSSSAGSLLLAQFSNYKVPVNCKSCKVEFVSRLN